MDTRLVVDAGLLKRYGGNGPRYTSYPTADRFVESFDEPTYRRWLGSRSLGGFARPLGLYVHIPFCDTLCFYCACNKIATKDRSKAGRYVASLEREMDLVCEALAGPRTISKMHWGGGTPTFLGDEQSARLIGAIRSRFELEPGGEYAIEVDPRKVNAERIAFLGKLGFNRISIGVQDFDPDVQRAVNRIQSVDETRAVIDAARANGFKSVNIDLIFGLPKQTVDGFLRSLDRVLECDPDRIALYSYAHLPSMFSPQKRILESDLPAPDVKLELMTRAIAGLGAAGYAYIGMDHFAKPTDELTVAQREGRLIRDFQGYSAGGDCDLIGLGVSSIGKIGPTYVQSVKDVATYDALLNQGRLPVLRGIELNDDDVARRAVIQALACQYAVAKQSIEAAHRIDFDTYFARELEELKQLAGDGLVELNDDRISVTPRGRLLVRAVCMVFDGYLRKPQAQPVQRLVRYSRVM